MWKILLSVLAVLIGLIATTSSIVLLTINEEYYLILTSILSGSFLLFSLILLDKVTEIDVEKEYI